MFDPKTSVNVENGYVCGGFRQIVGSRVWFVDQNIYYVDRFKMAVAVAGEEVAVSEDIRKLKQRGWEHQRECCKTMD